MKILYMFGFKYIFPVPSVLCYLYFVFLVSFDFSRSPGSRPLLGTGQCHGGDDGLCLAGCESIRCADSNAAESSLKENK